MTHPLIYRWRKYLSPGREQNPYFGRRCRVLARGSMNTRLVEFENGELVTVSGNALRKAAA